jgi:hypothetical protein
MLNDSMSPRIRRGMKVIVEPAVQPIAGQDDVVVCLRDGSLLAGEFVRADDESITVSGIDGRDPLTFKMLTVAHVHCITQCIIWTRPDNPPWVEADAEEPQSAPLAA